MDFDKNVCPITEINGLLECGKQFDLDITIPCDNREVIYGVIRDCFKEPICDAVVKLVEITCEHGNEERLPVSHTFTNFAGEFVFGPLCPNKNYAIEIWGNKVKHVKACIVCEHSGCCLKGEKLECCEQNFPPKDCKELNEYNENLDY